MKKYPIADVEGSGKKEEKYILPRIKQALLKLGFFNISFVNDKKYYLDSSPPTKRFRVYGSHKNKNIIKALIEDPNVIIYMDLPGYTVKKYREMRTKKIEVTRLVLNHGLSKYIPTKYEHLI